MSEEQYSGLTLHEQEIVEAEAARRAAAQMEPGLVTCGCGRIVEATVAPMCRCGKRVCWKCGTVHRVEGLEDELYCGAPECERKIIRGALGAVRDLLLAEIGASYARWWNRMEPLVRRQAELEREES